MRAARDRKRAIEREFPILTPREVPVATVREAENATPDTATPVAPAIPAEVPPVWSESEEPARVTRRPTVFRTGQMLDLLRKCDFAPPGMGEREPRRPRVPWDREATI